MHTGDRFGCRLGCMAEGMLTVVGHHEPQCRFPTDELIAMFCRAERPRVADLKIVPNEETGTQRMRRT